MKSLAFIITIALAFRFYGLNWDQNHHLHPDERFLTMVSVALNLPSSWHHYFSTSSSSANPHNIGFPFYVYGILPLVVTKGLAVSTGLNNYDSITLLGRSLSAVLDTSLVLLVFLISKKIFQDAKISLYSALFYALCALPIQLSHFFAVDTFLVFFLYLAFYFFHILLSAKTSISIISSSTRVGIALGLAIASKVSAILFFPIILLGLIYWFLRHRKFTQLFLSGIVISFLSLIIFRIASPYSFTGFFTVNPLVLSNLKQLKSFDDPSGWFPPAVQWIHSRPILFPLENIFLWGLGPVLATIAAISLFQRTKNAISSPGLILHLVWIIGLFFYQSFQFAKPLRYFYPLYPSLAIISGPTLAYLLVNRPLLQKISVIALLAIWPLAFVSIYSRPHSRVTASQWISSNLPAGSVLSCEHWDDCLPLGGSGTFRIVEFPLYSPDTLAKWQDMSSRLSQVDYLILTSNRLYGSITSLPEKYPTTSRFYQDLFTGKLGFTKIAEFTSRPNLPIPGINWCLTPPFIHYGKIAAVGSDCPQTGVSFVDDYADESWTVYDHPKVIIFSRQRPLN